MLVPPFFFYHAPASDIRYTPLLMLVVMGWGRTLAYGVDKSFFIFPFCEFLLLFGLSYARGRGFLPVSLFLVSRTAEGNSEVASMIHDYIQGSHLLFSVVGELSSNRSFFPRIFF